MTTLNITIKPESFVRQQVAVPPSKSHTMRAIHFASLASGISVIDNYLHSPDTRAMLAAWQSFGAKIKQTKSQLIVTGCAGAPRVPTDIIDVGNSGQVLRFLAPIAALLDKPVIFTGDHSIKNNRPSYPTVTALQQLGVAQCACLNDLHPPLIIQGPLQDVAEITMPAQDSQPVSGLMMALLFSELKRIKVNLVAAGERPWLDLTFDWLDRLGLSYQREAYQNFSMSGLQALQAFHYTVPGDFSSMAFPLAAALITGQGLEITGLDFADSQGDSCVLEILTSMGAQLQQLDSRLIVASGAKLVGRVIDVNHCIDALPILAAIACYASGETRIMGGAIARQKESDRIVAMHSELSKLGAVVTELEDGLIIQGGLGLAGGVTVHSHQDHRIAMSLAVAALGAQAPVTISDSACIAKSYPGFERLFV